MADTLQTVALLALGQQIRGRIVPTTNRLAPMLRLLPFVPASGKNISWDARGSGVLVENYAEGADAANFGSDERVEATLSFARVRANVHISGSAWRAAMTNQAGPEMAERLLGDNIAEAAEGIASEINVETFSGDGTSNKLTGLDVAIGSDSNTYAGVDKAAKTFWQPTVVDPGVDTPITFAQIRSDRSAILVKCGRKPNLALASPTLYDAIGGLYDDNRRYVQSVTTGRGTVTLDAGISALEFEGMVILEDKDATAKSLYYLNTSYVHYEYQPLDNETIAQLMQMGVTLAADDGYGPTPLGIRYERLAKNGDSERFMGFSELNLVVRRPNACGVRKHATA